MNPNADRIIRTLVDAGHIAYYAGGCVRDQLLGRPPTDFDIATSATPDQVQPLFQRASDLQGKAFGVVRVLVGGQSFEVATFRRDGPYLDGRRPDHIAFATAEDDARRRDFTINGLFYDPLQNQVIDFVGGQADLTAKRIRAIGDPEARFTEDALRLFRAIRFASQLDFTIDPETWNAILRLAPTSQRLAAERVRDELVKCLTGPRPGHAYDLLDQAGLLRVWIPECEAMKGVEQPPQFHPEGCVHTHTRLMLGMLQNPSIELALAVLFHDIAKPETKTIDASGRIRFNEHEVRGARTAERIMKRLRFSNEIIETVTDCIANHMTFKDVKNMRLSTLKRFLSRPHLDTELELHRLDCASSHGALDLYDFVVEKRAELAQTELAPPPLLTGRDLIAKGIPPGPAMGRILDIIRDEQLEGRLTSTPQALGFALNLARDLLGPDAIRCPTRS
ncbi:MAG: CCA tRNA nucleotidyltransferase [Verrucomicrobiia bacterium]